MNKYNRSLELSINRLALTLEGLEEYIRHAGYYSNWRDKEQFYRRTIQDGNKWDLENDEECFLSNLYLTKGWFKHNPESFEKETQKEFYKWIDHSGITAENCPEKLKHYLNEINEILEGRGENFYQAYKAKSKEEWKEIKEIVKSPVYPQANREVCRLFFGEPIPIKSIKIWEVKIAGNAEQGQKTFQEIKNSITSQPEWTFLPFSKKYLPRLEEKIKELEGKKDQPRPKEEWKREINLESFDEHILMSLELYIQKLNYYPDWEIREWTEKEREDWRKNWENKTAEEIKNGVLIDLKGTYLMLRQFKADDPDYYPFLLDELKAKFSQWQSERKIDPNNCPDQLKKVLFEINEVLEGRSGNIWEKNGKDAEEIAKIIVELRLEIAELLKKYKLKNEDLGFQFRDWENQIKEKHSVSEIRSYQQKIKQAIQAKVKDQSLTASGGEFSWPTKIAIGVGIIGIVFGTITIIYQVIKNKKVKK